jgi:enoyl-CoA hydratase
MSSTPGLNSPLRLSPARAGIFGGGMDLKVFVVGEVPSFPGPGIGFTERPPRKPVIAAVEDYALAGRIEIVLAADLVIVRVTSSSRRDS